MASCSALVTTDTILELQLSIYKEISAVQYVCSSCSCLSGCQPVDTNWGYIICIDPHALEIVDGIIGSQIRVPGVVSCPPSPMYPVFHSHLSGIALYNDVLQGAQLVTPRAFFSISGLSNDGWQSHFSCPESDLEQHVCLPPQKSENNS